MGGGGKLDSAARDKVLVLGPAPHNTAATSSRLHRRQKLGFGKNAANTGKRCNPLYRTSGMRIALMLYLLRHYRCHPVNQSGRGSPSITVSSINFDPNDWASAST